MNIDLLGKQQEVVVSFGNYQITGKDCMVTNLNIEFNNPRLEFVGRDAIAIETGYIPPIEVTMTFMMPSDTFNQTFFDEKYKPKIRNKKVEDCSVQELIFAARSKIKNDN